MDLDGWQFERWCLKVFCGLLASGWTEGGKIPIPHEFVEIAFGKRKFEAGAGLYILEGLAGVDNGADNIQWNFLHDSVTNTGVCGIIIVFRGLINILITRTGDPKPVLKSLGKTPNFDFTNANIHYRPENLSYKVRETKSEIESHLNIEFKW